VEEDSGELSDRVSEPAESANYTPFHEIFTIFLSGKRFAQRIYRDSPGATLSRQTKRLTHSTKPLTRQTKLLTHPTKWLPRKNKALTPWKSGCRHGKKDAALTKAVCK
jgi:hypothetical protein